jgi:hypothetical protein
MNDDDAIVSALFDLGSQIRYVAVAENQSVFTRERPGLAGASSGDSDRYEELLVNPALVTLARQRGEIDCGGLRYVVVRYGNFFQVIVPHGAGHVSVAVEPTEDPTTTAETVIATLVTSPPDERSGSEITPS